MNDSIFNTKRSVPAGKMEQLSYTERAKARKTIDCLCVPDSIIADASTATLVTKGSLLRIKGTDGGYVSFGPQNVGVPSNTTANTIETEAGFFFIVATDDYVRTSAAMRIEVIID